MSLAAGESGEWDLPHIVGRKEMKPGNWWPYDVKFYPYTKGDADPVFAVVGIQNVINTLPVVHPMLC